MITTVRRRPRPSEDNRNVKVDFFYQDISSIHPYPYNPRDNAPAIDSVANSIKSFGFLIPVVIDSNNILVAGHTRVEAAKKLGLSEIPAVRAEHLNEEQINAFRLIDNKVAELAKWDFDMLAGEVQKLSDSGIILTDFGWDQDALDCLTATVASDCLDGTGLVSDEDRDRLRNAERRAPLNVRVVIGEIVFFLRQTDYRTWIDQVRVLHDYSEEDIIADIKQRLGMREERTEAAVRVRQRLRRPQ